MRLLRQILNNLYFVTTLSTVFFYEIPTHTVTWMPTSLILRNIKLDTNFSRIFSNIRTRCQMNGNTMRSFC